MVDAMDEFVTQGAKTRRVPERRGDDAHWRKQEDTKPVSSGVLQMVKVCMDDGVGTATSPQV